MADNFVQFSEVISDLTEEEAAWLSDQLDTVAVIDGEPYSVDDTAAQLPAGKTLDQATWRGPRFLLEEQSGCADRLATEADELLGFAFDFSDCEPGNDGERELWLYSDEHGDLNQVTQFVQKFLRRFRPDQSWTLTYAETCSKPRIGEFGGGAVVVRANAVDWHDVQAVADRESSALAQRTAEGSFKSFSSQELATILAALRHWQATVTTGTPSIAQRYPHFDDEQPLSADAIDRLCESLNHS